MQDKTVYWLIPAVVLFSFGIDIYIPFMYHIQHAFRLSDVQIQLTLSIYLFALAIGQISIGLISDYIGRIQTLRIAALVFIIASIACILAPSGKIFIAGRFFQGIGACGLRIGAYALVKDAFDAQKSASHLSFLFSAVGLSPMIAPLLGGVVGYLFGWRAIFVMLLIFGILCFWFTWKIRINPVNNRIQIPKPIAAISYLFIHPKVWSYGLISAVAISAMFSLISILSFVIQREFALSSFYIYCTFIIFGCIMLISGRYSKWLIYRWGRHFVLKLSFSIVILLLLIGYGATALGFMNILLFWGITAPILGWAVITNGCAIALAGEVSPALTGLVIAVVGTIGYGAAAINATLISWLGMHLISYWQMISMFALIAALIAMLLGKKQQRECYVRPTH